MTRQGEYNKMRPHVVEEAVSATRRGVRAPRRLRARVPVDNPAQTQLTVVLVIDMVESVRLMQTCEAAIVRRWLRTVHRVRNEVLLRHRGQIVKSMGDGLMARFGEVRDAVAAAIEIHAMLAADNGGVVPEQQITVRAGLHVAQAWSDGTDLYGAGVNLAARLAALGGPGETIGSAEVRDGLTQGLDAGCEDLGECYLKHFDKPVRAYRIGAAGATRSSPELQRAFSAMQPTIAVIPFSSRGGDAQHFAIGELIADGVNALLSGSQHLRVVSRLSTTAFRDRAAAPADIEAHLGVTYVLSGSYAALGQRLLISAELARAGDAQVVWSERIGGNVADLLQVRSEVIDTIAQAVNAGVFAIETRRTLAQPLPTLESYALLLGGIHRMHCSSRGEFDRTAQLFEYLIERHQRVAAPRTWLAHWYILRATRGISLDRARDARIALHLTPIRQTRWRWLWKVLYIAICSRTSMLRKNAAKMRWPRIRMNRWHGCTRARSMLFAGKALPPPARRRRHWHCRPLIPSAITSSRSLPRLLWPLAIFLRRSAWLNRLCASTECTRRLGECLSWPWLSKANCSRRKPRSINCSASNPA